MRVLTVVATNSLTSHGFRQVPSSQVRTGGLRIARDFPQMRH